MKILLVEDDKTLFEQLKKELEHWDLHVEGIENFDDVLSEAKTKNPEIIIMDVELPKYDGFYWCRQIRHESNVPILFLSARDNPMDQVMSMELGADDFIQKPFYTNVLIAKLKAVYRRVYQFNLEEKRTMTWGNIQVDLAKGVLERDGEVIYISKTEMLILEILLKHRNEIVSRDEIITALWDDEAFISDNTLTVNINRLRKKLSDFGLDAAIETRIGKGYIANDIT
ncbi:DNA-binding response regulator [Staphylococcus condimenti]|uniref:Response regulator protein GraR n=1 Tax=Staphylococcus condimenti TaxID=70255 RepID=A0A4Q7CMX7_9STAP|nr:MULTISPECIES: response regulator transcription factor [Staphylococcus]APR61751.1 DNA-binding response regulator [Staphylococcus condimenti]MDK8644606.1 response regulator transcription factor [Staphylococcus condimenti]OFP02686.1 DNA-binding response regulator [Staphylococcus sp. HMSC065E08]RZI01085.1 DNA-binding response regulator [Staphylococcus condimenti]RZI02433.1 DNA-binding response regulator [Staphylococcus condimenti]